MTDQRDEELDVDELDALDEELDDEVTLRSRGGVGFLSGLLLGALIGAGVALLVAPERGTVTRRRLTRGVKKLADDTRDQVEDWADDAKKELRRQRRRVRKRLRR